MEISFENSALHRLCCSRTELRRKYGPAAGDRIAHRLGQIASVDCLDDLGALLVRCRPIRVVRPARIAVQVESALHLVVEAADVDTRQPPVQTPDWREIAAVTIIDIETAS